MQVKIKDIDNIQKELKFELENEDMDKYLDKAANRLSKEMKVKGFRDGKVPREVVESSVGKEKVWQEAANDAIQDSYWNELDKKNIEPIGMPKINVTKLVPGSNLEFTATVPVMPELDLPDYKQIAQKTLGKEQKDVEVEEKEVDASLKWLQRSRTQADDGGEVKEEEDIEFNDEFAQSLGDFKNMEELRSSIKEGIKAEKEKQEKERVRLLILEHVREKTKDLKIPDLLVDQELDKMEEEFANQISRSGMTMEQYFEQAKTNREDVRKGWREKAEERVATGILLRAIADEENIEADPDEVEKEANKYLLQFGSIEEAQKNIDPNRLKSYISGIIRNEKVFELLEGNKKEEK
ncbi:MAG: trigger factor [Candidatus Spechtbacterales bacterium]|nr:trigger factor [Candidatus Spechtbacterales bacterium]